MIKVDLPYSGGTYRLSGAPSLDADRIVASLADREPGEFFLVDANGGMAPDTVLRLLRLLPASR